MCREFDLQPGESLDLMTGWDFDLEEHRRLAMERVKRDKPTMVVGSPPCTFFSTLQELNKHNNRDNPNWIAQFNANLEKAVRHIKFCVQIYKVQMDAGRYWLHEHPWSAKSWQIPEPKELLEDPRVEIAYADQCQFGLTAPIEGINGERGPAKKPTGFAGNSWTVMEELRRKCPGDHIHVRLEGGKAKQAAIYTEDLCRTICRGIRRQVDYDAKGLKCMGSIDKGGLETLIKDMIDTAEEYLDQHDDPNGSRGELPPTTDEAGRVAEKKEDAVEQRPQPKPVSQKKQGKLSWASLTEEEELTDMENQIEHALIENAKKYIMELKNASKASPRCKGLPGHWKDLVHDEDGGMDMFGRRTPQDGRTILKCTLMKLGLHEGFIYAQDDVSGVELDPELVKKARQVEMTFFKKMQVYTRMPRAGQRLSGGKIIGVRWVDVNKGDLESPDYRSRLVGQEFKTTRNDELYASTPPLEALRFVISSAATDFNDGVQRHVMVNDVRRAYFYARTRRDIFIELPEEDAEAKPGEIGKLNLSLYGTRDAASNWQEHLSAHMLTLGFERGIGHPSVFHHRDKQIVTLVHGDDYTSAGSPASLRWFRNMLEKEYEIKSQMIGPEGSSQGKVLNRVITWTGHGYELEADPRHSEMICEQLGLQKSGGITTAGAQNEEIESPGQEQPLETGDVTLFRGLTARSNYLSADRPEMMYASKEVCREMAAPSVGGLEKMVRIGKFLAGRPRVIWEFPNQSPPDTIDVYVDANWAGCRRTRKSTSGGCAMLGLHCIKAWSKTQAVVAKSSGESELYGVIRGSTEALGLVALASDLGSELLTRVHVDANAAKGMVERRGLSRVRHIEVDNLWIQEKEARRMLPLEKVAGGDNPADLMTKNVGIDLAIKHMTCMGIRFGDGRAEAAAKLHCVAPGEDSWKSVGSHLTLGESCAVS